MTTPMTAEQKHWIDTATYEQLLRRWRFTPSGDVPIFNGESGAYYAKVMRERRGAIGPEGHTAASKAIGWEP